MSEEKKAIETLKEVASDEFDTLGDDISPKMAQNILNLIDKKQKEIEELKAITQNYNAIGGETFEDDRIIVCSMKYFDNGYFKKNFIFKDKIESMINNFRKVKTEILNNENVLGRASITYDIVRNDYCEKMLNQLLEEK